MLSEVVSSSVLYDSKDGFDLIIPFSWLVQCMYGYICMCIEGLGVLHCIQQRDKLTKTGIIVFSHRPFNVHVYSIYWSNVALTYACCLSLQFLAMPSSLAGTHYTY